MGKLVVGVGNVLLGDEGVGCHVAHALEELSLPDVKVIDGGTCPDALQLVEGADKLVIVDAVKGGGMPGQVYRFSFSWRNLLRLMPQMVAAAASKRRRISTFWRTCSTNLAGMLKVLGWPSTSTEI